MFLHHSIAGWPSWDEYSNIIGGKFLYKSGKIKGRECSDSGYRHFVNYKVSAVGKHQITRGLDDFELEDELYLSHVFEKDINPNWEHPDGSNVIGWTKSYKNSAITYLQFGDSAKSYKNNNVRMLIRRSIDWVIKETKELKKV